MNLGGEGANSAFCMTQGTKSPAREITRPCNTCNKAEVKKETMPLSHLNALVKSSYRSRLDHHNKNIVQIHHLFLNILCTCAPVLEPIKPQSQPWTNRISIWLPNDPGPHTPHLEVQAHTAWWKGDLFSWGNAYFWPFFLDLTSENGWISNQNDDNWKWTFNPAKITCWGAGQQETFFFSAGENENTWWSKLMKNRASYTLEIVKIFFFFFFLSFWLSFYLSFFSFMFSFIFFYHFIFHFLIIFFIILFFIYFSFFSFFIIFFIIFSSSGAKKNKKWKIAIFLEFF